MSDTEVRLADEISHSPEDAGEWQSLAELLGVELERIDRMAQVAWRLYDARQYREAAAVFRGLTQLDPENIDLYRGYSLAAAKDNDLLAATEALDQALLLLDGKGQRESDRAQLLALRAAFLYRAGRRREAVESAQASLEWYPTAPWADALRRGIQRAKNAAPEKRVDEEALAAELKERLEEVLQGNRSLAWAIGYDDEALLHLFKNGAALLDAGYPARARRIFEGLVALDSDVPLFHLALAAAWEAMEEHDLALDAYDDAIDTARLVDEGADVLADALIRRAKHSIRIGDADLAAADLDEALALPDSALPDDLRARARSMREGLLKAQPNLGADG